MDKKAATGIGFMIIMLLMAIFSNPWTKIIVKNQDFEGEIVNIFKNEYDHNNNYFEYKLNNKVFDRQIHSQKLFDTAKAGDYIIKKRGASDYLLIKNKKDTLTFNDIE